MDADGSKNIFNFGFIMVATCKEQKEGDAKPVIDQALMTHLLRAQCSCADLFFEKLRGASGVQFAKEHLADYLRVSDMDTETRWCLASELNWQGVF